MYLEFIVERQDTQIHRRYIIIFKSTGQLSELKKRRNTMIVVARFGLVYKQQKPLNQLTEWINFFFSLFFRLRNRINYQMNWLGKRKNREKENLHQSSTYTVHCTHTIALQDLAKLYRLTCRKKNAMKLNLQMLKNVFHSFIYLVRRIIFYIFSIAAAIHNIVMLCIGKETFCHHINVYLIHVLFNSDVICIYYYKCSAHCSIETFQMKFDAYIRTRRPLILFAFNFLIP